MPSFTCKAWNSELEDESLHKLHYKSQPRHRYKLKPKEADGPHGVGATAIKPFQSHATNKTSLKDTYKEESEDSGDEWEDVDPDEDMVDEISESNGNVGKPVDSGDEWEEVDMNENMVVETTESNGNLGEPVDGGEEWEEVLDGEMDFDEVLDPSCCFMCDSKQRTIKKCLIHMHKHHGFFIPDVEYLQDPKGLLTYLGLKVRKDFICLYCNDRRRPFNSLEAVRKHMEAKSHCKVRYGDGMDDEEAELDEFYDYSSSYPDEKQLVAADDQTHTVKFGCGGAELVITRKDDTGTYTKALGFREYLRYYRQKPRPTAVRDVALAAALSSRYKSMGLKTVQSREHLVRLKVLRVMNKCGVDAMRSKIGMKSNLIRNLPRNCSY